MTMASSVLLFWGALLCAQVTSRPDLPKFNPITLRPPLLHDSLPFRNDFTLKDPVLTKGINLTIQFPPHDVFLAPKTFEDRSRDVLRASLRPTLQQFNTPAGQIQEKADAGIPLLISAIQELLNGEHFAARSLERRNILDSLFGWAKDAGCALVAAGGLPLFLLAAADFAVENTEAGSTTPEQDFFLFPIHGNLAHDAPVQVYYQATRAPFFKGASGTTFNRNVYTALSGVASFSLTNFHDFEFLTQVLIHELTHVEQYRQHGYDLTSFGYEYLFQWCSNGGYDHITLEVDAFAQQHKVDSLLLFDSRTQLGNEFFQVWRTRNLNPVLGYPTAVTYSTISTNPFNIRELSFQRGALQIKDGPCFRTFTSAEVATRDRASCNPDAKCLSKREPLCPVNKDCGPGRGGGVACTSDEKAAQKAACLQDKSTWKGLSARGWTCNLNLPVPAPPPPPPPPPKPGCPPDCDIVTLIPPTSKPCHFDEPPLGCDHGAATQNNKECRAKRQRCSNP